MASAVADYLYSQPDILQDAGFYGLVTANPPVFVAGKKEKLPDG